jgi:CspA family cold shock protein
MSVVGVVRTWHDEDGWGVVDSAETPGGCWTHYSAVAVTGYRSLSPGQEVELEYEQADQDGYAFRAVRAWPQGQPPAPFPTPQAGPSSVYRSTLTITFDNSSDEEPQPET